MNVGKYRLTVPLGVHDGKTWWLAEHRDSGTTVAIALMNDQSDEATVRFITEARDRARSGTGFTELGKDAGRYYLAVDVASAPAGTRN